MLGRMAALLIIGALFLASAVQVACADRYIPLDAQFTMNGKNIDVYILGLNVGTEQKSNIHYDVDPQTVYWIRLDYQYDNYGSTRDQGFVTPVLVDTNGNQYRYKENEPTTQWINPQVRTGTFWLEIPVPKNATLTEIIFLDGTIDHSFRLTMPTVTPVPATPTPSGTPVPGRAGWHECIPLLPFALAGGLAAAGMVINHTGITKR